MALVLILGSLILLSILVIAFMLNVRQDMSSSTFYASGASTRQLADMANNLVIAQITDATSDGNETWISQPGLLRTFTSAGPKAAYKLYSSDVMKVNGDFDPSSGSTIKKETPKDWFDSPNEFVDLNKSVTLNTGTSAGNITVYPIVDPTAADANSPATPLTGTNATWEAEGFTYNANSVIDTSGTASSNPLPMPVRWIYVLADGSFATWAEVSAGKKPIGRIAFWSDDECSKININTASDGVFFDTPAYWTKQDYWFGITQPVAQEYQRFTGHPATTSLASALKVLRDIPDNTLNTGAFAGNFNVTPGPSLRSIAAAAITPRISAFNMNGQLGGSKGAISQAWLIKNPVALDSDRLYTSIDELAFGPKLNGLTTSWSNSGTGAKRFVADDTINSVSGIADSEISPASLTTVKITPQMISKLRFFLTANSRAPEVNVFNRPRVSLWPFNNDTIRGNADISKTLTPEDRLLKFSSEIGANKRKLYFQRQDAWDTRYDYTGSLMAENRDLYAYLQMVTAMVPPNAGGGTFATKYGARGRDQILTEIFDYIRSAVNTYNFSYMPVTLNSDMTYGFPQKHAPGADKHLVAGLNDVTPIIINAGNGDTKGMGTSIAISEVYFDFYNAGEYLDGQTFSGSATGAPNPATTYGDVSGKFTDVHSNKFLTFTGTGTPPPDTGADNIPDYIIRRVRLVCMMNFFGILDHLNKTNMRFLVRIKASGGFGISAANNSLEMRLLNEDGTPKTGWSTSVPDIGFPSTSFRSTIMGSQLGEGGNGGLAGGAWGYGWGFLFPVTSWMGDNRNRTAVKAITNSPGTVYLNSAGGGSVNLKAVNAADNPYWVYPFVSDMIEFRFPHPNRAYNASLRPFDPAAGEKAEPISPFLNGSAADFFEQEPLINFTGAQNFTIEIYRALKNTDNENPAYKDDWTVTSATKLGFDYADPDKGGEEPLMTTSFKIDDRFNMPLPRLAKRNLGYDYQAALQYFPVNFWSQRVAPDNGDKFYSAKEAQYFPFRFSMFPDATHAIETSKNSRQYTLKWNGSKEVLTTPYTDNVATGPLDTVFSYHISGNSQAYGDLRLVTYRQNIPSDWWIASKSVPGNPFSTASDTSYRTTLGAHAGMSDYVNVGQVLSNEVDLSAPWYSASGPMMRQAAFIKGKSFNAPLLRNGTATLDGAARKNNLGAIVSTITGDFTIGIGDFGGGAAVVGPDVGSSLLGVGAAGFGPNGNPGPYYVSGPTRGGSVDDLGNPYFTNLGGLIYSPLKQIPSAVVFGSLPSRVLDDVSSSSTIPAPWETLLFCPNPSGGRLTHRGWTDSPRDHYLLDLFYLPVVEPYAITENLATAGKINLNYQIAPFTYIQRRTGMYGVLRNMQISAVLDTETAALKHNQDAKWAASSTKIFRLKVDPWETLKAFDYRFSVNKPFVSPSEITEMYLYPRKADDTGPFVNYSDGNETAIEDFWAARNATGDDKKEAPYNAIYPRLTTKSNTFQVHYWVQTLKTQDVNGSQKINVTGEYRGSSIIERYLNLDRDDYGTTTGTPQSEFPALSGTYGSGSDKKAYYKYRIINTKQFAP